MEAENLQLTSQLLQAILIGSSALAGFAGILIAQFARLARTSERWDRWVIGLLALVNGASFIFCVIGAITWFNYHLVSNLDMARNSFFGSQALFCSYFSCTYLLAFSLKISRLASPRTVGIKCGSVHS